jgi:hypothetical protein
MDLTMSKEATERRSDDGSSLDSRWGGSSSDRKDDQMVDLTNEVVERAWLWKANMRWVRNDRSPLNAFRWFVSDWLGIGDPPSRVEVKSH